MVLLFFNYCFVVAVVCWLVGDEEPRFDVSNRVKKKKKNNNNKNKEINK